jgi:hypothetical protein
VEIVASIFYHLIAHKMDYLETLYYTTQIVSSIFVVSGVVVAVWQYYLSCRDVKTNLEIMQVQRAIDLSEYYKDNILKYLPAIYYVFDKCGATKILNTIRPEQMQHFDQRELKKLLNPGQIKSLKNITQTKEFLQAVLEANEIYNLNLKFQEKVEVKQDSKGREATIYVKTVSVINAFMSDLITQVLNNMEYFALHFKHKTADESVVYQSLHSCYLESMQYLYYYIADRNDDPADKLYTNVTGLYLEWRKNKEKQDKDRSEKANTIQRQGTVVGDNA